MAMNVSEWCFLEWGRGWLLVMSTVVVCILFLYTVASLCHNFVSAVYTLTTGVVCVVIVKQWTTVLLMYLLLCNK